ncbi:MAG: RNA pyrophosphohydrolase [Holosporaceae bacterium]|jgi:putative (di)nucleoside polyphosphate hydrolase|nr:RNA pyrophosphohydrolase [Holosporaceae bacterium]
MSEVYRKCVAIFLSKVDDEKNLADDRPLNGSTTVLAAERSLIPNAWQIPQGGVDAGEQYLDAAIRELYEETGIKSVKIIGCTDDSYKYDYPDHIKSAIFKKYGTVYAGQEVKFFLFEFIGNDDEINLQISENQEFSRWRWMPVKNLLGFIVEFKKNAFQNAARDLQLTS